MEGEGDRLSLRPRSLDGAMSSYSTSSLSLLDNYLLEDTDLTPTISTTSNNKMLGEPRIIRHSSSSESISSREERPALRTKSSSRVLSLLGSKKPSPSSSIKSRTSSELSLPERKPMSSPSLPVYTTSPLISPVNSRRQSSKSLVKATPFDSDQDDVLIIKKQANSSQPPSPSEWLTAKPSPTQINTSFEFNIGQTGDHQAIGGLAHGRGKSSSTSPLQGLGLNSMDVQYAEELADADDSSQYSTRSPLSPQGNTSLPPSPVKSEHARQSSGSGRSPTPPASFRHSRDAVQVSSPSPDRVSPSAGPSPVPSLPQATMTDDLDIMSEIDAAIRANNASPKPDAIMAEPSTASLLPRDTSQSSIGALYTAQAKYLEDAIIAEPIAESPEQEKVPLVEQLPSNAGVPIARHSMQIDEASASKRNSGAFGSAKRNSISSTTTGRRSTQEVRNIRKLKSHRKLPECFDYKDIPNLKTSAERSSAYALKLQQMSQYDSGLGIWVEYMRNRNPLEAQSVNTVLQTPEARRPSVLQAQASRRDVSVEFPTRQDALKATDLTSHLAAPSSFAPTNMPYPGALPTASTSTLNVRRSSTPLISAVARTSSPSSASKTSTSFLALARKGSSRQKLSISGPIVNAPSGPRLIDPFGSHSSKKSLGLQPHLDQANLRALDEVSDILPTADRATLQKYLAQANGDQVLAVSNYLEQNP